MYVNAHSSVFSSTIKRWDQPKCPSVGEQTSKRWYTHTAEYYSAMKRNDVLTHGLPRCLLGIFLSCRTRHSAPSLPCEDTRSRGAALGWTRVGCHRDGELPASRSMRHGCLLFKPHSLCHLSPQPKPTESGSQGQNQKCPRSFCGSLLSLPSPLPVAAVTGVPLVTRTRLHSSSFGACSSQKGLRHQYPGVLPVQPPPSPPGRWPSPYQLESQKAQILNVP